MRTSLNEIEHIEKHLLGELPGEESLLVEVKMSLNESLAEKVASQEVAYALVKQYGRRRVRQQIANVERKLFETSGYMSFRQRVFKFFG